VSELSAEDLTRAVIAEAHRLGFVWAGVTGPNPPAHLAEYRRWISAGRHGEMGYLATDRALQRRADPLSILPECRSILVLGAPHPPPESAPPPAGEGPHGRVAAYAWGDDYHESLKTRLGELVAFIEGRVGRPVTHRTYTDTGPLLERELAQRAGLGWIGKNTCLINPGMGSYFLLAEVLLGVGLVPDRPFTADHCGSCTRCLEACPTGCILPDRTLDARRCISYLTIELKGAVPPQLRPALGAWIFGCDICQQVCPWNQRFARPQGDGAFQPRRGVPLPALHQELNLSAQEFNRKFKGSPIRRTKRRGYLRNVAIALGNAGNRASVPVLAHSLSAETEPLVRRHAAWALGRIGSQTARQALESARSQEQDPQVLAEIAAALDGGPAIMDEQGRDLQA
jgi:epoxyqueuosine reductase